MIWLLWRMLTLKLKSCCICISVTKEGKKIEAERNGKKPHICMLDWLLTGFDPLRGLFWTPVGGHFYGVRVNCFDDIGFSTV